MATWKCLLCFPCAIATFLNWQNANLCCFICCFGASASGLVWVRLKYIFHHLLQIWWLCLGELLFWSILIFFVNSSMRWTILCLGFLLWDLFFLSNVLLWYWEHVHWSVSDVNRESKWYRFSTTVWFKCCVCFIQCLQWSFCLHICFSFSLCWDFTIFAKVLFKNLITFKVLEMLK